MRFPAACGGNFPAGRSDRQHVAALRAEKIRQRL